MITELDIKGFKSILDQKVNLRNINILIGGNGIGKSNFISAFDLLRNIYRQNLQGYVISKGKADALLYLGRKYTPEIDIDIHFDHDGNLNRYMISLTESQNTLYIKQASTSYLYNGVWHDQVCDRNKMEASLINDRSGQAWYVGPLFEDFEVYHFHDTGDTSPMKKAANVNDNRMLKPDGSNIAAFLYFLQERYPKHFVRIEKTIASVSPFFRCFNLAPERLNPDIIDMEWQQIGATDVIFNANQLSDGTLRFICLATLLMQPNPPETIIIDEPELGLHPSAINKLSALIKKVSSHSQVIISTQSVNLVDQFTPNDIIVVNRVNNASVFQRLNEDDLKDWLDCYSLGEVWEKNIIGGQPF